MACATQALGRLSLSSRTRRPLGTRSFGQRASSRRAEDARGPMRADPHARSRIRLPPSRSVSGTADIPGMEGTALCTSLTATTVDGQIAEMKEAIQNGADIVEIRLDFIQDLDAAGDIPRLVQASDLPCIVTFRPSWEGGRYEGDEAERLAALRWACEAGAEFVDVELRVAQVFFRAPGDMPETTAVIVSHHDYEGTPEDPVLQALLQAMWSVGADVVKIATTARDVSDARRVLALLEGRQGPTIALAMGERGVATRILAPKFGGFLTFGALSPERQSAPGQPTIAELRDLYRLKSMNADTRVYGVVGNPVSQSKSPAIHNPAFAKEGVNAVYLPFLVDDFGAFLQAYSDPHFAGFSVTIPHKEVALRGADRMDEVATRIGACNTLVRQPDGGLQGYNTDWAAALDAIERAARRKWGDSPRPLEGRTVVVLGAGGAARGIVFGAASRGAAKVIVVNRTRERAEALAAEVEPAGVCTAASPEDLDSGGVTGDVLANTTSVGMTPKVDDSPVPAGVAARFGVVFDAVYNPRFTRLLREAKEGGAEVADGVEMFVGQAAAQFKYFTGKDAPVDLMTRVVEESLAK